MYGYETWSITQKKAYNLMVFENTVLIKIFGAKKEDVTRREVEKTAY